MERYTLPMGKYKPSGAKILGGVDATLSALFATKAVADGFSGRPVATTGEALGAVGMGYEAYRNFTEGMPKGRGYLIAGFGLGASGIERLVYAFSEERPSDILMGSLDLAIGGIMLGRYAIAKLLIRNVDENNEGRRRFENWFIKLHRN